MRHRRRRSRGKRRNYKLSNRGARRRNKRGRKLKSYKGTRGGIRL